MEFTGNTESYKRVEIRARVKGFLNSVHFKEGDFVEKGDLLFKIDPLMFQAQVNQATAVRDQAKVQLDKTVDDFKRMETLFKKQSVSEQEYVRAKANRDKAAADVLGANALLEEAKLNLGYTEVRSPIAGKIGKYEINVGNLVGDGQATLLTTVVSFNPIFAYFNVREQELLKFIRKDIKDHGEEAKTKSMSEREKRPVTMALADETDFSHQGYIDYADYQLDAAAGTFLVRAIFPNKNQDIVAGLFVRIRVSDQKYEHAILVNENAFSADIIGRYLFIVDKEKENRVEKRYIQKESLGALIDGYRIVKKGLSPDDLVITNGIQRARDGLKVNPHEEEIVPPKSLMKNGSPEKAVPVKSKPAADKTKGKAKEVSKNKEQVKKKPAQNN